jgi:hypothetical protein
MSNPKTPLPPAARSSDLVQQRDNGFALAGFVCGLLATIFGAIPFVFGLYPAPVLLGLLGIVFSVIGRRRARREPARGGGGLALAGIILGLIGPLLELAWILLLVWTLGYD